MLHRRREFQVSGKMGKNEKGNRGLVLQYLEKTSRGKGPELCWGEEWSGRLVLAARVG
jgi:hypothetical protein